MNKPVVPQGDSMPYHRLKTPEMLQEEIRQAGLIVGLNGLEVVVSPGAGWSCSMSKHGLTITADPDQLIERRAAFEPTDQTQDANHNVESQSSPNNEHIIHTIFHELGHARDFMDPEWTRMSSNGADRFFYNIIDDSAVDGRNRKIPLINTATKSIYENVLFPESNLVNIPSHAQLMYSVLLSSVTPDREIITDDRVSTILNSLQTFIKNGQSYNLLETLADHRTTLKQRNFIAKNFIKPYFDSLLEQDRQEALNKAGSEGEEGEPFEKIYADYDQAAHGHSHEPPADGNAPDCETSNGLTSQLINALKQLKSEEAKDDTTINQDEVSDDNPTVTNTNQQSQILALAGGVAKEMSLEPGDAMKYAHSIDKCQATIHDVADVFLRLASPTSAIRSPRYKRNASIEGLRLHPHTLAKAAMQLEVDIDQPIWQQVERRAPRQELEFGGIDIHLLVDVSGSMGYDNKAQCAADTALCLLEGLQLAKYKVSNTNGLFHQPDVRTQIIAFGSGATTLSPISPQPTNKQKGKTYTNLINPNSKSTLVTNALKQVNNTALANPNRESLVIIISDGDFHDHDKAKQLVASIPEYCMIAQLVIGYGVHKYIANAHENIIDPQMLPSRLLNILDSRITK